MSFRISIVPSHEIDRLKWNECVSQSANALIYGSKDYLDGLADNWTGIVVNDYDAVMPVAWRKKLGVRYSYVVPFIQQLGIYSKSADIPVSIMLPRLFEVCRYGDYDFNFANSLQHTTSQVNFILSLHGSYNEISAGFSNDALVSIRKASEAELQYIPGSIDESVEMYRVMYRRRLKHMPEEQYERFKSVAKIFDASGKVVVRKIVGKTGQVLAAVLLINDGRRLYNIINSTSAEGRLMMANYYLFSRIWKEFEGTGLVFDFEGSDVPGVNMFYRKFSPVNQPYQRLHFNHLPMAIKWLKK